MRRLVVALALGLCFIAGSTSAHAVTTYSPVMTCHFSRHKWWITGEFEGGWPNHENERLKFSGFNLPFEVYTAGIGVLKCSIVYDADFPMPDGAYTKTLCAPLGQGTVPGTPSCFPAFKPR